MAVQRRLCGLPGIQAGKPVKPCAMAGCRSIEQAETQCQLANLNLGVGQQLGGLTRPHLQAQQRSAHVHAIHRVGAGNQLVGQLNDAHQRMRSAPARQRLGVKARRVGQPAIWIHFSQIVGGWACVYGLDGSVPGSR